MDVLCSLRSRAVPSEMMPVIDDGTVLPGLTVIGGEGTSSSQVKKALTCKLLLSCMEYRPAGPGISRSLF
jgi:hypothetical protein